MQNNFVTVLGRTGYGKTFLIRERLLQHYKRLIIFDTMNDFKPEPPTTVIDVLTVANFEATINSLMDYETEDFTIRIAAKQLAVYCDILDIIVNNEFKGVTLILDEIDKFANPSSIEQSLYNLYNVGRHFEINIIAASRRPNQVHRIITSQSHLLVLFHTNEPRDLAYLREYANKEIANRVKELKRYEYIIYGDTDLAEKLGLSPKSA